MKGRHLIALLLVLAVAAALAAVFLMSDDGPSPLTPGPTPQEQTDTDQPDAGDGTDEETAPVRRKGRKRTVDVTTPYVSKGLGSLVGILREYGSDRPLAGVEVRLVADGVGPDDTHAAMTADDGAFAFAEIPNYDDWEFQATAPAPLADTRMAGVSVVENRQSDVGIIYLSPAFAVEGTVKDEKGQPVRGALVRAVRRGSGDVGVDFFSLLGGLAQQPNAVDSATTDTGGRYALEKVPPGTYDMLVSADGFRTIVADGLIVNPDQRDRRLDFTLASGLSVRGRVERSTPGPIEGLRVLAFPRPQGANGFRVLGKSFALTNADGHFELHGLTAGHTIVAVAPEGSAITMSDDIELPTDEEVVLTIAGEAWLLGQIKDDEGTAIEGAEVLLVMDGKGAPSFASARTDEGGNYRLDGLLTGRSQGFIVRAAGFAGYPANPMTAFRGGEERLELKAGENRHDVELSRGSAVAGTVVSADDDAPLSGVRVTLMSAASLFGGTRSVTTGPDGTFELTGVSVGPAVISLSKDGWYQTEDTQMLMMSVVGRMGGGTSKPGEDPGEGPQVSISEAGQRLERRLTMATGLEVNGVVLSPDGDPVPGAEVAIAPPGSGGRRSEMMEMLAVPGAPPRLTDIEGRFRFPGVRPDKPFVASVRASGYVKTESDPITASVADELAPIEIRLKIGATLAGVVRDQSGEPLQGASIRVTVKGASRGFVGMGGGETQPTGPDGTFRIPNLQPAEITVTATHPRYLTARQDAQLTDDTATDVEIAMELGKVVSGTVIDHEQKPVGGARVRLQNENRPGTEHVWRSEKADADGSFEIAGLPPGDFTLTARSGGFAASEEVAAAAGTQGVTLRLREAFSITGTVRFTGGGAAVNARVRATEDEGDSSSSAETDDNGHFELKGLVTGTYTIEVSRGNAWGSGVRPNLMRVKRERVPAGAESLVIEVRRGAEIAGRVTMADGKPAADGWINVVADIPDGTDQDLANELRGIANDAHERIKDGAFRLQGLPRGSYTVTASVGSQNESVRAETGDLAVSIQLSPSGGFSGVVTFADGSAAAHAYVRGIRADGRGASANTDKEGRFEALGVTVGTYTLKVSLRKGEKWFDGELTDVQVQPNAVSRGHTIALTLRE